MGGCHSTCLSLIAVLCLGKRLGFHTSSDLNAIVCLSISQLLTKRYSFSFMYIGCSDDNTDQEKLPDDRVRIEEDQVKRVDDTLSTRNTFSFPPHISHK